MGATEVKTVKDIVGWRAERMERQEGLYAEAAAESDRLAEAFRRDWDGLIRQIGRVKTASGPAAAEAFVEGAKAGDGNGGGRLTNDVNALRAALFKTSQAAHDAAESAALAGDPARADGLLDGFRARTRGREWLGAVTGYRPKQEFEAIAQAVNQLVTDRRLAAAVAAPPPPPTMAALVARLALDEAEGFARRHPAFVRLIHTMEPAQAKAMVANIGAFSPEMADKAEALAETVGKASGLAKKAGGGAERELAELLGGHKTWLKAVAGYDGAGAMPASDAGPQTARRSRDGLAGHDDADGFSMK